MHVIIRFIYFYSFIHQQYNDDGVDLGCGWGKTALALFFRRSDVLSTSFFVAAAAVGRLKRLTFKSCSLIGFVIARRAAMMVYGENHTLDRLQLRI